MDAQHKKLFQIINEFHQAAEQQQQVHKAAVICLDKLVDYVNIHFADEEQVMFACDFPQPDIHQKMHQRLTEENVSPK